MREILYDRYLQRLLKCVLIIADVPNFNFYLDDQSAPLYSCIYVGAPRFDFQLEILRFYSSLLVKYNPIAEALPMTSPPTSNILPRLAFTIKQIQLIPFSRSCENILKTLSLFLVTILDFFLFFTYYRHNILCTKVEPCDLHTIRSTVLWKIYSLKFSAKIRYTLMAENCKFKASD